MRAQLLQRVQQGAIGGDVLNASDEAFNRVQTELNTFLTRIFIGDAAAEATGQGNRPILREQVLGEAGADGTMITRLWYDGFIFSRSSKCCKSRWS